MPSSRRGASGHAQLNAVVVNLGPQHDAAWKILHDARRIELGDKGLVFTTNGDTPISGFSKFKTHFDGLMLAELRKIATERGDDESGATLPNWTRLTPHGAILDVSSCVTPDHVERAVGHVIGGVRGVYDRHSFREEKAAAFAALAARVEHILRTSRW